MRMSLLNCAPCPPSRLRALSIIDTRLRALPIINTRLRAYTSCVVVSIVSYSLRLKNPREATGPDFILLKVIKFASNVIDSHLCNIIIKGLEKNNYSEEPKAELVRSIFMKNETNKQDKKLYASKYSKWNV